MAKSIRMMDYADKQILISLRSSAEEGNENAKAELREMFEALQKDAEDDNPIAWFNLGLFFYYGVDTDDSDEEAAKWFKKAAFAFHKSGDDDNARLCLQRVNLGNNACDFLAVTRY